jgi:hypothetical protein
MISDEQAEKANDFIRDKGKDYAKAKADRVHLEQFRKTKKAMLYVTQAGGTVSDREAFAYSHPDYVKILDGIKAAVEIEETLRWQIEAAALKIEIWRTQQANQRKGF